MEKAFHDHFTPVATSYAAFRPTYPDALFSWLASLTADPSVVWDCACGSGQASVDLARYFDRVIATDASAAQLALAPPHPAIEWRVATAESSGIADSSVDLVTVAQALHWFDLPRFYAEVKRVLRPRGVLAAWCYGIVTVEGDAIDSAVQHFYHHTVGPFWPDERRHVENGYREFDFPFTEFDAPSVSITVAWTLPEFLGYLRSWSATSRFESANGHDPVIAFGNELSPLWGEPSQPRTVSWPLAMRVGRV